MEYKKQDIYELDKVMARKKKDEIVHKNLSGVGMMMICRLVVTITVTLVLVIIYVGKMGIEEAREGFDARHAVILTIVAYTSANLLVYFLNADTKPYHPQKRKKPIIYFGIFLCALGIQALQYFLNVWLSHLGISAYQSTSYFSIGEDDITNILIGSYLLFFAPVSEELFFRKLLIDKLNSSTVKFKIMLSAILFGLSHGNVFQAVFTTLAGILFAYIYTYTGNIVYSIVLHILCNISSFIWGVVEYVSDASVSMEQTYYGICVILMLIVIIIAVWQQFIKRITLQKKTNTETLGDVKMEEQTPIGMLYRTPTLIVVVALYVILILVRVFGLNA